MWSLAYILPSLQLKDSQTVMVASLIHANTPDDADLELGSSQDDVNDQNTKTGQISRTMLIDKCKFPKSQITLVVAPMSLISQWKDELERASHTGTLSVMLYYAATRGGLVETVQRREVDVVVTSYGTLAGEHKKFLKLMEDNARPSTIAFAAPLFAIQWHRVILDEAHNIKNRTSGNAKSCTDLITQRRWCLTGTPIVNRLTDLYSLLRFLRVEPWGDFTFFNTFITKPFLAKNTKALDVVAVVLESVLLRREKHMKDKYGRPIVQLPPKQIEVVHLDFSEKEREIYNNVYSRAKTQYDRLLAQGQIGRNFSIILSVILRLRQAVCHPLLVLGRSGGLKDSGDEADELIHKLVADFQSGTGESMSKEEDEYTAKVLKDLIRDKGDDDEEASQCPLCFEEMNVRCLLPKCMHHGCKDCLTGFLQSCEDKGQEPCCPTCRAGPVAIEDIIEVVRTRPRRNKIADAIDAANQEDEEEGGELPATQESVHSQPAVFFRRNNFQSSTKLNRLVEDLDALRVQNPSFKAVVFSQFTSFLDLVEVVLKRNHWRFVRLDGASSQKERERVLREFRDSPKQLIMLISLKAGGVGLNRE